MEFHGKYSIEFHGTPWNSMEVFYTGTGIVDHAEHIFSGKYLTDNLAIYSSIHAIDVLEIFQELFDDIDDFENEMDELHLLKKHYTEMEIYLLSSAMSTDTVDDSVDELEVLQHNLDF